MAGGLDAYFQILSAQAFQPVTNTYNTGSGNETIPSGSSFLSVYVWGPGGDGFNQAGYSGTGGGGGGGVKVVNIPIVSGDWGNTLAYVVGTDDPTASTVDGTIGGNTLNLDANAGSDGLTGGGGGGGGTASANSWAGGGTATAETGSAGGAGVGGDAALQGDGGGAGGDELGVKNGTAPGGGGAGTENSVTGPPAGAGAAGRVKFVWT